MSLIDRTKEFFGLGPMDIEADDAYYADERSYESNGSAAYAPRSFEPALEEEFVPTIVALSSFPSTMQPRLARRSVMAMWLSSN